MKSLLVLILLLSFFSAMSQLPPAGPEFINNKRSRIIVIDYGGLSSYELNKSYKWKGYGVGGSAIYSLYRNINIGAELYYNSLISQPINSVYFNYSTGKYIPISYKYQLNTLTCFLKGQLFYLNHRVIGLYAGLDLGFVFGSADAKFLSQIETDTDPYNVNRFAYQITVAGVNFIPTNHLYGIAEVGYGNRGIATIGIGYKL